MKNDIPKQWVNADLNDLVIYAIGGDWGKGPETNDDELVEVACIRGSEFRNWESDHGSTASLRRIKRSSLRNRELREHDILVEISGGGPEQPVGRTVLIEKSALTQNKELPKVCTNFVRLVRISKYVSANYLNHFLSFFYKSGEITKYQAGSNNLRNLKFQDYLTIRIPISPLAEQKRIVAKIEELFSEIYTGVESLRLARAQLIVYRQSLLKQAFEGKLTEKWRTQNPDKLEPAQAYIKSLASKKERSTAFKASTIHDVESWSYATLDQITDYITSGSRGWAKFYSDSGSVFIRAQNLNKDKLDISDIAYVRLPTKTEGKRTQVKKGDLLVTITGANVTKTGVVDRDFDEAYVSQHVALCRILDTQLSDYVYRYFVAASGGRKVLEELAYGAGKPGLNLDNLRSLEIPIPSLQEIPEIVHILDEQFEAIEQNEREIDAALRQAEVLRQSILKKAFSGQLVPQDPNDEPASTLLERIQAQRQAATNNKAPKKRPTKKPARSTSSGQAKKPTQKPSTATQTELSL